MDFLEELKQRKVIRVGMAYAIGAWLTVQVVEIAADSFGAPEWLMKTLLIVLLLGLPVSMALAWAFEFTDQGLKRDRDVAPGARRSGNTINAVLAVLLISALGYIVWDSRSVDTESETEPDAEAVADSSSGQAAASTDGMGRSIAVLPFENFSGQPDDDYFADGLTDTLLHKLAQINELKVIARNSSSQFKATNQDLREVGEILGVETILEGSVQRAGDRVRIIAQLIRTSDGAHVWSQNFDDTMDNIFDLQDRVTASIVDQFQLSLSAAERDRMMRDGTDQPQAYDLLIQALNQRPEDFADLGESVSRELESIELLNRALEIDPAYAPAWAALARVFSGLAFASDSQANYARYTKEAEQAAREALRLAPDTSVANVAMGWVSHRESDRLEATRYFRRALDIEPNSLDAMSGLALQLGYSDPQAALDLLNRSHELDPTSSIVYRQKHFMLVGLGRVEEAIEQLKLAIDMSPDSGVFYNDLSDLLISRGRPGEGAIYTSRLLTLAPGSFEGQLAMAEAWLAAGDNDRARSWIELALTGRDDSDTTKLLNVERLIADGQYQQAIEQLEDINQSSNIFGNYAISLAVACLGLGQFECVEQQGRQFQAAMQEAAARGNRIPELNMFPPLLQLLSSELSGVPAVTDQPLEKLLEQVNQSRMFGQKFYARAGLLARLDEPAAAMQVLEDAVTYPNGGVFNIDLLGLPVERSWLLDPLRDRPDFQEWMTRHSALRERTLKEMILQESSGEIVTAATVKRMAESASPGG